MKFYLVENERKAVPSGILGYAHIKGRADGLETLITSKDDIGHPNLTEKTQAEAQAILDGWIDQENENQEIDIEGNNIKQRYISLAEIIKVLYG